jgi:glucosamine-6-phosphate deaminase
MKIRICDDRSTLAQTAAEHAVEVIRRRLTEHGQARIVVETGESQLEFFRELSTHRDLDWANVEVFCATEYIGLPAGHPAGTSAFLKHRLITKTGIKRFFCFEAETNLAARIAEYGAKLRNGPLDLAVIGIGENGRLLLNSPPADFDTESPYITVDLDFAYRSQQVSEGWFVDVGQVPMQAVTMSVRQILKACEIIALAPGSARALAAKVCAEHGVSPTAPATILQSHSNTSVYLDRDSSALLSAQAGNSAG